MKPEGARTTSPSMDLSETALEEAARLLPAAREYVLVVTTLEWLYALKLLRALGASVSGNPFAPWVNLKVDEAYAANEWSLSGAGETFWSPGA